MLHLGYVWIIPMYLIHSLTLVLKSIGFHMKEEKKKLKLRHGY